MKPDWAWSLVYVAIAQACGVVVAVIVGAHIPTESTPKESWLIPALFGCLAFNVLAFAKIRHMGIILRLRDEIIGSQRALIADYQAEGGAS